MAVLGSRADKFESESGANANLESRRSLAAGRANLKQKRPRHEFGITAVLGGRAGKLESENGADTNLELRRSLVVGRANLKAKAVQTRIWNHGGPWRPGGQN